MGKVSRYAGRHPTQQRRVVAGDKGSGQANGADPKRRQGLDGKLELNELRMLIGLVEWRHNMLCGQAVLDNGLAQQRRGWAKLLEKLERMETRRTNGFGA